MKKKDTILKTARPTRDAKTSKVLPKIPALPDAIPDALPGSVIAQRVRCGRTNCRCTAGSAALHGPYFYHYWRECGRPKKRYLKSAEVAATRAACERGRLERQRRAVWRKAFRVGNGQTFAVLIREAEAMLRSTQDDR